MFCHQLGEKTCFSGIRDWQFSRYTRIYLVLEFISLSQLTHDLDDLGDYQRRGCRWRCQASIGVCCQNIFGPSFARSPKGSEFGDEPLPGS